MHKGSLASSSVGKCLDHRPKKADLSPELNATRNSYCTRNSLSTVSPTHHASTSLEARGVCERARRGRAFLGLLPQGRTGLVEASSLQVLKVRRRQSCPRKPHVPPSPVSRVPPPSVNVYVTHLRPAGCATIRDMFLKKTPVMNIYYECACVRMCACEWEVQQSYEWTSTSGLAALSCMRCISYSVSCSPMDGEVLGALSLLPSMA